MTPLATLADRVEAAEGADERLDDAIHDALDRGFMALPYTASWDAAMSLALEGWVVAIAKDFNGTWMAGCQRKKPHGAGDCQQAATAPLAITTAWLRARASESA